jgi:hypothetical protein
MNINKFMNKVNFKHSIAAIVLVLCVYLIYRIRSGFAVESGTTRAAVNSGTIAPASTVAAQEAANLGSPFTGAISDSEDNNIVTGQKGPDVTVDRQVNANAFGSTQTFGLGDDPVTNRSVIPQEGSGSDHYKPDGTDKPLVNGSENIKNYATRAGNIATNQRDVYRVYYTDTFGRGNLACMIRGDSAPNHNLARNIAIPNSKNDGCIVVSGRTSVFVKNGEYDMNGVLGKAGNNQDRCQMHKGDPFAGNYTGEFGDAVAAEDDNNLVPNVAIPGNDGVAGSGSPTAPAGKSRGLGLQIIGVGGNIWYNCTVGGGTLDCKSFVKMGVNGATGAGAQNDAEAAFNNILIGKTTGDTPKYAFVEPASVFVEGGDTSKADAQTRYVNALIDGRTNAALALGSHGVGGANGAPLAVTSDSAINEANMQKESPTQATPVPGFISRLPLTGTNDDKVLNYRKEFRAFDSGVKGKDSMWLPTTESGLGNETAVDQRPHISTLNVIDIPE